MSTNLDRWARKNLLGFWAMDPDAQSLWLTLLYIAISFGLVAFNGFFVAAEFSIVKVRRTRLEELSGKGVAGAKTSLLLVDQLDEYLSATQLGITLVSLALGWIGEHAFYGLLQTLFPGRAGLSAGTFHSIAIGLSFLVITMLHVVLGELVPKSMAIQRAEQVTLLIARPLSLFYRIAKPLIHSFTMLANFILARLGFHGHEESALSEEELKMVMQESHEEGVISENEAQIITRAFEFSDKCASDIMVPADKVQYLSLQKSFQDNLEMTRKRVYTRFPVTQGDFSTVIGIVHMKDALNALARERTNRVFEIALRPAVYVDPGMRQDQLMQIMKKQRTHMMIVQDPRTKVNLGLVTMEDILVELVGDFRDEHGN